MIKRGGGEGRRGIGAWLSAVTLCVACSADTGAGPMGDTSNAGSAGNGGAGAAAGVGGAAASGGVGGSMPDDDAGADPRLDAGGASSRDGGGLAPRGTGPGDWEAGDYPADPHAQTYLDLKGLPGQNGAARQFKVHVPPSYDSSAPAPVVFCFHGLAQNPVMFCVDGAGMLEKSDAEGFVLVMPFGIESSWNAGTCCGGAANNRLDDVGFVRALFDEVARHVNIDLARVYATGLSNGGYMSYRLACQAADLFVAVAPGAGAIGMDDIGGGTTADGDFEACEPTQPVSVLAMHGTADGLIPYSTVKPSLDRIAMQNGCGSTTGAATQPASGGDTTCVQYAACPSGIDVAGCTVMNGGHVWFGDEGCGTGAGPIGCGFVGANSTHLNNTDAAWDFFAAHAR